jgi:hypothetical protein
MQILRLHPHVVAANFTLESSTKVWSAFLACVT